MRLKLYDKKSQCYENKIVKYKEKSCNYEHELIIMQIKSKSKKKAITL